MNYSSIFSNLYFHIRRDILTELTDEKARSVLDFARYLRGSVEPIQTNSVRGSAEALLLAIEHGGGWEMDEDEVNDITKAIEQMRLVGFGDE